VNGRLAAGLLLVAAVVVGALVLGGSDDRYLVKVQLDNAGGLRKGANVRVAGAPAGRVTSLELDSQDHAVAELRLDPEVAPVGAGARAVVDTDGFFGERFVQIDRGDLKRPEPSGAVIPAARTSVSVRLDDVVDALDLDTRDALKAFLSEQGTAVVGRGRDLAAVLAALPPSLDRTTELISQFAADNKALGRLIESGDRVLVEVAREHDNLGRLVNGFGQTLDVLDSRRNDLGETFRRAPATLRSARGALVSLEAASKPLIPAAHGLRSTAPALTDTLEVLPDFTKEAVPALDTIARVSPALQRLGTRATPIVRELKPMATVLSDFTQRGLEPFSSLLSKAGADVLGTMEGWARSTQGRDGSSHIFRFGATSGSDTLGVLLTPTPQRKKKAAHTTKTPKPAALPKLPVAPKLPGTVGKALAPVTKAIDELPKTVQNATELLDFLLKP
jgi:phospholipid/cholesterol/gamma-HCH transport system substrate-binding protein